MKKLLLIGSFAICFNYFITNSIVMAQSLDQNTKVSTDIRIGDTSAPHTPEIAGDTITNNNVLTHFGIAYQTTRLATDGEVFLNKAGEQVIPLYNSAKTSNHVGIKDTTRSKHNWSLTAMLNWDDTYIQGVTIDLRNTSVKENKNGTLSELMNDEVRTTDNNPIISSSPVIIMKTNDGKNKNGTYDFQFSSANLNIPDASRIPKGSYNGQIVWNLELTPGENPPEENFDQIAIEKVEQLFNGNELASEVNQEKINDTQNSVDLVTDENLKQELQEKIDRAQHLLNIKNKHFVKDLFVTTYPSNITKAGLRMGNGHDRQALDIQLKPNAKIKIKQINPEFKENLTLRFLTNSSQYEKTATVNNNEITVTADVLTTPFIDTPYLQTNNSHPIIEYTVEGDVLDLPIFTDKSDQTLFLEQWKKTEGFALIQGKRFQTYLPFIDYSVANNTNLKKLISTYDNDIIGFYNYLIGLSDTTDNWLNKAPERRYFYKADAAGEGSYYYKSKWAAQTSWAGSDWLTDKWGPLHETGHGYEASFKNKGMNTTEVWNNIFGVIYKYKQLGKDKADRETWLYNYGQKGIFENEFKQLLGPTGHSSYNGQAIREQLIILSNLIDKAGIEGLQNFYIKYRELAWNDLASKYNLQDLLVKYLGYPRKYNYTYVLNSWGLNINKDVANEASKSNAKSLAHLVQVVPEDRLDEAISLLTKNYRLSSVLSLVTNDELEQLGLKSNITLRIPNFNYFIGDKLNIYKDNQLYRTVVINEELVQLDNMPNGVYTLQLNSSNGEFNPKYIFVKEDKTIELSLTNYIVEAEEVVNQLFIPNSTVVKTTIMQKDIDNAKNKLNNLPDTPQKEELLKKINSAYSQIQEFTFAGFNNSVFTTLNIANNVATIRRLQSTPHNVFKNEVYAAIIINRNGKEVFKEEYIGDKTYLPEVKTFDLKPNDIVILKHRESSNNNRFYVNHSDLKYRLNAPYTFKVNNNGLLEKQLE